MPGSAMNKADRDPRFRSRTTGAEPSVLELMEDPIVHLIMRRDGLRPSDLWRVVEDARRSLGSRRVARRSSHGPPWV